MPEGCVNGLLAAVQLCGKHESHNLHGAAAAPSAVFSGSFVTAGVAATLCSGHNFKIVICVTLEEFGHDFQTPPL